jgi:radical SAM protein with 4Fe4S-binding SPASM domain
MRTIGIGKFYSQQRRKIVYNLLEIHFELTYGCDYGCIHCFCRGQHERSRQLSTAKLKKILDRLARAGCLWLTFSGGDPLVRPDFSEIYRYAKAKGFIITVMTNGFRMGCRLIRLFKEYKPYSIEVTFNGMDAQTYEAITAKAGSFGRAQENIVNAAKAGLPLIIKSNAMRLNWRQISRIKDWAESLLGKKDSLYRYLYDPFIYPRLNGDRSPLGLRLSPEEIQKLRYQDPDIARDYQRYLRCDFPRYKKKSSKMYLCNSWKAKGIITPFGELKFCLYSHKFSRPITRGSISKAFQAMAKEIDVARFEQSSACQGCSLRPICNYCPAQAELEMGDESTPSPFYCALTKNVFAADQSLR